MPGDVLRVTGGQDHGARFGLNGAEATIGRGPVMDIVLTDPRVSRRHARVAVRDAALVVEDLSSSGGTTVNGVAIAVVTALAPGDRIGVGATELTVVWTPGGAYAPPPPPPPAPAASPPPPRVAATAPRETVARPQVLLPIACLALAAFALVGVWMPALGDPSGTDSLWSLSEPGFRVHAIVAALLTGAAAGGWLASVVVPRLAAARVAAAAATGLGGGLVAGLPLFLAAIDLRDVTIEAGAVLLALAGIAVAACAVAGIAGSTAGAGPPGETAASVGLLAAGGGIGGLLALVASPLTWVTTPTADLGGFDEGFQAGGWLVPLALAVAAVSALTLAVSRTGEPRAAMCLAAAAAALAGAAFAFVNGAAIGFDDFRPGAGLSLAMTGTAIAVTTIAIGGVGMAVRWEPRA